jgi:hypothetical protein
MINAVFMFVIAGMGLQERLALKAALNFMVMKIRRYQFFQEFTPIFFFKLGRIC